MRNPAVTTQDTLQTLTLNGAQESLMRPSPKRARRGRAPKEKPALNHANDDLLAASLTSLTKKDLEQWKGWIEVESEPAFFNAILQDLGVKNARTQEVFSLDDLATLGNAVFGLIFLSEYTESDEDMNTECSNVWFANQTMENSCATVALLNLIMNAKSVNLGETLLEFKNLTQPMDTVARGKSISENPSLRSTHNQFASRMDMLNADLALDNQTTTDGTGKRIVSNGDTTSKRRRQREETSFHYVAFVKSSHEVWELDGLRAKPVLLGKVDDDLAGDGTSWLSIITPIIEARMQMSSSGGFSLLSVIEDPLWSYATDIATSLATIRAIETHLIKQTPSWDAQSATPLTPLFSGTKDEALKPYRLTQKDIEAMKPNNDALAVLESGKRPGELLNLRSIWIDKLQAALDQWQGQHIQFQDETMGSEQRNESFLPAIHEWTKVLAELDELKSLNALASGS
ncbi:hypothetical protein BROUX41_002839 [Berkeleyomyces rouxiae]|uniref:uncharacterized protein n=1 Tax=Berkeleyomyces rouxiae TaxID=2035830 RepID=UPI003B7D5351